MIRVFLLQEEGLLKSDIVDGEKVLFLQHVGNILTTWKQQKFFHAYRLQIVYFHFMNLLSRCFLLLPLAL